MSREIKFRAWHSGVMFGPFQIGSELSMDIYDCIEQYTGRKDTLTGKDVYEGDKVNIITDGREINNLTVMWSENKCGFVFTNEDWNIMIFRIEHIEIIGNIHEETEK